MISLYFVYLFLGKFFLGYLFVVSVHVVEYSFDQVRLTTPIM